MDIKHIKFSHRQPNLEDSPTLLARAKLYPAVATAFQMAKQHHSDQTRSGGEPYMWHPLEVATILADDVDHNVVGLSEATKTHMIVVALLHDTFEDTNLSYLEVQKAFGTQVAIDVYLLSDMVDKAKSNRALRIEIARAKLSLLPSHLQAIKTVDMYCNVRLIHESDPKFASRYTEEKIAAFEVVGDASSYVPGVYHALDEVLNRYRT